MSVTILRTVDMNANSHHPDRRLREAVYYIICVLRLNYASACGESLKVADTQHFLPIAKITARGGIRIWFERFGIRSGEVAKYICQISLIF